MKIFNATWRAGVTALCLALPGLASAAPMLQYGLEIEDWGTQFTNNPIVASAGSSASSAELNISPSYKVDRVETVTTRAGSVGTSRAQTYVAGTGNCQNPEGEGCVIFTTGDDTYGMLTLEYKFQERYSLKVPLRLFLRNITQQTFDVDAFFLNDSDEWELADQYSITPDFIGYKNYDFAPGTETDQIMLMYNPLAETGMVSGHAYKASNSEYAFNAPKADIHVELCCIYVPEPGSIPLVGLALGVFGFIQRKRLMPERTRSLQALGLSAAAHKVKGPVSV